MGFTAPSILYFVAVLLEYSLFVIGEFSCWDESEQATMTFINNPNRTLDHLPTIRLIQGYYPSQYAMQYAAYVYLKEKLGVNVTFWPENDPSKMPPNSTIYGGYPSFYFEAIAQDQYDLLFEIWDVAVESGNGYDYFDKGSVLDKGISGVFGEGGWFVPKYVYDDHPEWTLPSELKTNESLRELFIDSYTIHSDENWIDYWWSVWNDSLDSYLEYGYEIPNASTPIIWGSYAGYAISGHSQRLVENLMDDGMDWNFAPLKSESALSDLVVDLYEKELPFIANIYSPHLDFATTLENSTGYMEFERIALPRNPSNGVGSVCYSEGTCTFPLTPLEKLANPNLQDEFEEMVTFALDFKMTADDVNDVMAFHAEITGNDTLNFTEHEKWQYAACIWLKMNSTESTINEWYQDITRYDCLFDDGE